MTWKKGNELYRLRKSDGRNTLFTDPEVFREKANEYFQYCEDNPFLEEVIVNKQTTTTVENSEGEKVTTTIPYSKDALSKMRPFTLEGLCNYMDICVNTFKSYEKKQDFIDICNRIRMVIDTQQYEGAAANFFSQSLIARRLGLIERRDVTSGDQPINKASTEDEIDDRIEKLLKKRSMTDDIEEESD